MIQSDCVIMYNTIKLNSSKNSKDIICCKETICRKQCNRFSILFLRTQILFEKFSGFSKYFYDAELPNFLSNKQNYCENFNYIIED